MSKSLRSAHVCNRTHHAFTMISYIAGKAVVSQMAMKRFIPYRMIEMSRSKGEHEGPDPIWEGCPLVFEGDVQRSMQVLYGHLTFDPKTAAISHVAPSVVVFCTNMYVTLHEDAEVSRLFSGMVPKARVLGAWYDVLSKRLIQCTKVKHPICVNPEHDDRLPKNKCSHHEYCTAVFKRVLCDDCVEKTYFRHLPPTAPYVGSGYLAVGPLKQRMNESLWRDAFSWIERLNEQKILSLIAGISVAEATAILLRPYEAIACNRLEDNSVGVKRILAIIAKGGSRMSRMDWRSFAELVKKQPDAHAQLWQHGMVSVGDVFERKRKIVYRMKVIVEEENYQRFVSEATSGLLFIETAAVKVLRYLVRLKTPVLTVRIANRKTGEGVDCSESIEASNVLDCAEHACWGRIYAMLRTDGNKLVSGSLYASLTGKTLSVFSVLVELAVTQRIVGVQLDMSTEYLERDGALEAGDVRRLVTEQSFLESGEALPVYDEPVVQGRPTLDVFEEFVF